MPKAKRFQPKRHPAHAHHPGIRLATDAAPKTNIRTLAGRVHAMADTMCRLQAERGTCLDVDLQAEGFSRREIEQLGDQARDEAAARRRAAQESDNAYRTGARPAPQPIPRPPVSA